MDPFGRPLATILATLAAVLSVATGAPGDSYPDGRIRSLHTVMTSPADCHGPAVRAPGCETPLFMDSDALPVEDPDDELRFLHPPACSGLTPIPRLPADAGPATRPAFLPWPPDLVIALCRLTR